MDKNVTKAVNSLFSGNIVRFQKYVGSAIKQKAFDRINERRMEVAHNLLVKEAAVPKSNDSNEETTETSSDDKQRFVRYHNVTKTDAQPGRTKSHLSGN